MMVAYLLDFIPFWRRLSVPAGARAGSRGWRFADWFYVPEGVYLHRGHACARPEPAGVALGLDELVRSILMTR